VVVLKLRWLWWQLVGDGLFVRSMQNAHGIDPGFESTIFSCLPLISRLSLRRRTRPAIFSHWAIERAKASPGVESATHARFH